MAGGYGCLFPTVSLPHQIISLSSMNITEVDVLWWQIARLLNYHFPTQKIHPMLTPLSPLRDARGSRERSCP